MAIENEAQYELTKGWRDAFAKHMTEYDAGYTMPGFNASDPIVRKAVLDGMQSMVDDLTMQIEEYENAKTKKGGKAG